MDDIQLDVVADQFDQSPNKKTDVPTFYRLAAGNTMGEVMTGSAMSTYLRA